MTDTEIIDLFHARDERAISAMQEKYGEYCFSVVHRILLSREDAEECLSDALERVWETIPPNKPNSLKLYFTKIGRNLALSQYRSEHRLKRGGGSVPLVLDELSQCAAPGSLEEQVQARLLSEKINDFLATLSGRERTVFLQRYYFMKDLAEIAAYYGLSKRHVSVLLFRTRAKLKSYLKKEEML